MSKKTVLHIGGMTCTNCALSVTRYLQKQGLQEVNVNFATGEATFEETDPGKVAALAKGIEAIGYAVVIPEKETSGHGHHHNNGHEFSSIEKKFFFSLLFTIPLLAHMVLPFALLHNPLVQLALCLPVVLVGMNHFGRSAWMSLRSGVPNMDVLIAIGSAAAFFYSVSGMVMYGGTHEVQHYLFFETASTIITLVFLGNLLEHRSVKQTTTAVGELTRMQPVKAKKISETAQEEQITEIEYPKIRPGDLLLVNAGDKIPVDGSISDGFLSVNESMITGESLPVEKTAGNSVIGGTIALSGNARIKAERVGEETVLSKIIELVKNAQNARPEIQKTGDRVSAVFVPAVVLISLLTFVVSFFTFHISIQESLMHSIAVLVISCPCAMGLATPTAVMVGIGRAAKDGILIKGGDTLENLAKIKTIVFDKTGTLTTGRFRIKSMQCMDISPEEARAALFSLEQYSTHPIAQSIVKELSKANTLLPLHGIKEDKGLGISATDMQGNVYAAGSWKTVAHLSPDNIHDVYLLKNGALVATLDLEDEVKLHAAEIISWLKKRGIKTIMLSGDTDAKCRVLANTLGFDEVHSQMHPDEKLKMVASLAQKGTVAMVGDGINDAPALAKATVGISLGNATQVAIQSAQVILLKGDDLAAVTKAISVSRHTLTTIKQNLFWAFFYNVLAIPLAAAGMLSPMIGALSMALSDVVVVGNSLRLKAKNIYS